MDYEKLKEVIAKQIKENGRREITGPVLQAVLMAMVDSLGEVYSHTYTDEEKAQARANIDALSNYDGEITKEKLSVEVQAILNDVANKQNITDESLATIAKTIVGAINEVYKGGLKDASIATSKIEDGAITEPKLDTDLVNIITSAVQPAELASALTTALASYVAKSDILDTTGSATDKVMSQNGVTEAINGVTNKVTELDDKIGSSEDETLTLTSSNCGDLYWNNQIVVAGDGSIYKSYVMPLQKGRRYKFAYTGLQNALFENYPIAGMTGTTLPNDYYREGYVADGTFKYMLINFKKAEHDEGNNPIVVTSYAFGLEYDVFAQKDNINRIKNLEQEVGLFTPDIFELGNITITGRGWVYSSSETRVRTKKGVTIHLTIGDYIEMPSSCRYYLGWLTLTGEYHYKGWLQNKFEVTEEADYVILMRQEPEVTLESVDSILGLLKVNFGLKGDIADLTSKVNKLDNAIYEFYEYRPLYPFKNENAALVSGKYNIQTSDFRYARWFDVSSFNGMKLKISCGISSSYPYAFFDSYDIVNDSVPLELGGENSQIVNELELYIPNGAKVLVAVGGKTETSVSAEISSPKTEGVINIFNSPSSVITAIHGGTTSYPANTLGLYKQVFHDHILYWECDVRPCVDGYVLCHDDDIYNHAVNSDGSTIPQGSVLISDKTIAELKQYKFGVITNKQSEGVVEGFENETIPTLEEFLLLAKALGATPMIEIKFWATEQQIKDIMDIIKRYAMLDNAIIIGYTQVSNTIKWAIKYGAKNVELIINDGSGSDSAVDTAYAIVENDMSKLNKVIFAPMKSQLTAQTCIYASTKGMICGVWTISSSELTSKIMELYTNGTTIFTSDKLNVATIIKQQYL